MRKKEYLSSKEVIDFIAWVETILDTKGLFIHSYIAKKNKKNYTFDCLYSAFLQYDWGSTIDSLADKLKDALSLGNEKDCIEICLSILKWGGVLRGSKERILKQTNICDYLNMVSRRISLDLPSGEFFTSKIHMNSGFTKIYSAYIDDFIIYDSRVGAALGLLVRKFCEWKGLIHVPKELLFAWASGKESEYVPKHSNRRNPNKANYIFPTYSSRTDQHFENNIRANWLIAEIARKTKSKFASEQISTRAIEQALFMIGYDVSGKTL